MVKVAVFPRLALSSWTIPHKDGGTHIPLASVRLCLTFYILLSYPCSGIFSGPTSSLSWSPLAICAHRTPRLLWRRRWGWIKKQACVWVLVVLLLQFPVNLDKWFTTMTLSSLSAKQSSYIYLPVLFVGRTWKKSWKSTSGCSQHTQLLSKSGWDYQELFPGQNLALRIAVRVLLRVQMLPCICQAPCHCLGAARLALLDRLWAKECMHL